MKKLLITATFVATLATPALAQSYDPDNGNILNVPQAERSNGGANSAYAYESAPTRSHARPKRSNGGANSAYAYESAPTRSHARPERSNGGANSAYDYEAVPDRRWNSPTMEQYQTAPYQDENY